MKLSPRRWRVGKNPSRADADRGLARGRIIAESQNFARELGNEPSNRLTPRMLADRAEAMAREAGLAVEILDEKKIAELKMGALLSVAQGSAEPPRMIIITYTPEKVNPKARRCWAWSARPSRLIPAEFPSSPRTTWKK